MIWRILKQVPKLALAVGIILLSTGLFAWWWYYHSPARQEVARVEEKKQAEEIRKTASEVEARMGRLILLDDDLYDLDTGRLFFQNWLGGGAPSRLYYDSSQKKIIAYYGGSYVRYGLDGKKEAAIAGRHPLIFSGDLASVLYAADKDIWRADVDWREWKLGAETKLTSVSSFNDQNFAGNIMYRTEKTLIVHAYNKMLRVNLESGEVHPAKLPLLKHRKQRSPDNKSLVGFEKNQFYCYDIDTDSMKTTPLGKRVGVEDYQWLDNDHCLCVTSAKSLAIYDRTANSLREAMELPERCNRIGSLLPTKRFVFCFGHKDTSFLVNLERKTAIPVASGGRGISWVNDDSFAFTRDIPDSSLRGVWMQTAGASEHRILEEPFMVPNKSSAVMIVRSANLRLFVTRKGVLRMNPDGSAIGELVRFVSLSGRATFHPSRMTQIEEWREKRTTDEELDEMAAKQ